MTTKNENIEKVKLLAPDLRDGKEYPRSPRATLGGYVLAARAVDKCRAVLAGCQGEYHSNCPLDQRWLKLLLRRGEPVGYCSYARGERPDELKLEQLYLLESARGQGLGAHMLGHVEREAVELGCSSVTLTVNKANASSIAMYRKRGFELRAEARFDIGAGFVMDDYVMRKRMA